MPNKVVLFPVGKEIQCQAYRDWTDVQFSLIAPGEGGFTYTRVDAFGQSAAPYLGPPFQWRVGTPTPEPAGGPAMRVDGVLVDAVTWILPG